jgi:hypothetical protein
MRSLAVLLVAVIPATGFSQPDYLDGECHFVEGALVAWNGWPPNLRIQTSIEGLGVLDEGMWVSGIGLFEDTDNPPAIRFPEILRRQLPSRVRGEFNICYLGQDASVPYYEKPLPLFAVENFRNAEVELIDPVTKEHSWQKVE